MGGTFGLKKISTINTFIYLCDHSAQKKSWSAGNLGDS